MDDSEQKTTTTTTKTTTTPSAIDNNSDGNNDNGTQQTSNGGNGNKDGSIPPNTLMVFWMSILVVHWRMFTAYLYDSTVGFAAEFIADIVSHPRLQDILVDLIVTAINAFMDQDDIGRKMDDTVRRVMYDREKARETSRALGKEVVPMVTGFVGGVASSFTPSAMKRRKERKQQQQRDSSSKKQNNANATSGSTFDSSSLKEEGDDAELEEGGNGGWVSSSTKKLK